MPPYALLTHVLGVGHMDRQLDGDLVVLTSGHRQCDLCCIVQSTKGTCFPMTRMDIVYVPKAV